MSFSSRIKHLDSSDLEMIITDLGFEWEEVYGDYEEFHKALNEYLNQNRNDN